MGKGFLKQWLQRSTSVFKCGPLDHTKIVRLKQNLLTKVFLIKVSNFSKYGNFISKKYII